MLYCRHIIKYLLSCCSPPLTQFFLECGGLIRTDKKPALCKSYQKLVSELWHKNRLGFFLNAWICEYSARSTLDVTFNTAAPLNDKPRDEKSSFKSINPTTALLCVYFVFTLQTLLCGSNQLVPGNQICEPHVSRVFSAGETMKWTCNFSHK